MKETVFMATKRTNLIVDFELLKKAKKILDKESYSSTVNEALAEVIRTNQLKDLMSFIGSGVWSGELSEMRTDKTKSKAKKKA